MTRYIRAVFRHIIGYCIVFPAILGAIAVQALIFKPLFKNQTTVPHLIYRACGLIFGVRFTLNPDSAPFSTDNPTMFVSNHLSRLDFVVLPLFPEAAVMMNAKIHDMPLWGPIVKVFTKSSGFVATEQNHEGKQGDKTQLGQAAQEGRNIFVFPEGIQTDGRRVLRYSMGSAEIFYDPDLIANYPALGTTQLQPVVLRVKTIEGEDVLHQPAKWESYALTHKLVNIFYGMSRLSMVRSITVDVLVCPPIDPRDFDNAASLITAAQEVTREIIAPDQSEALTRRQWKARIDARDFRV